MNLTLPNTKKTNDIRKGDVKVRVPAPTTNLGAGFNCLGMALKLYNTLQMQEARSGLKIEISGEEKDVLQKDKKNLSFQAAKYAGAHGVSLSGAGSSVVAIANRYPQPIGAAMKKTFRQNVIKTKIMILDADNGGVKIQREK